MNCKNFQGVHRKRISPSGYNSSACFLWKLHLHREITSHSQNLQLYFLTTWSKWPLLTSDYKKTIWKQFDSKRQLVIFKSVHIFKHANTEQLSMSDSDSNMKPADYYDNKRSHAWNMVEITLELYSKHTLTCCYNLW